MSQDSGKRSAFAIAPQEELLTSLSADGSRLHIDPIVIHGRFWRVRLVIGWLLIVMFFALPHITLNGHPAILFDLASRQFHLFGVTFHPTDAVILMAFGGGTAALLFFVTAAYGRVWCGYGCPQTIYMEFLFRPIESLFEGKPAIRRRRNAGPWTVDKVMRKAAKWALYAVIAAAMAATFVAYFVGWSRLWEGLATAPGEQQLSVGVILFVTTMILVDFGYFRDQMCTIACPYGRLQNVLVDDDSIIIAYDTKRGEPRGKPNTVDAAGERGDCVDCKRCIITCPTGIDIRRGSQLECIGCAQCIEACDEIMDRLDRPRGLIRYASQRELDTGKTRFWRPRLVVYLALLLATRGGLSYQAFGRAHARVEFLRGGREAYRVLHTGQVANQLRVRITNQRNETQGFTISLAEPAGAELVVSVNPVVVAGNRVETATLAVKLDRGVFQRGRVAGKFVVRSDSGRVLEEEFVFLGPYR